MNIELMYEVLDEEKDKGRGYYQRTADRLGITEGSLRGHLNRNTRPSPQVAEHAREIAVERAKASKYKKKLDALLREQITFGEILDTIESKVRPYPTNRRCLDVDRVSGAGHPQDLALLLSDLHAAKVVPGDLTNGLNEFNLDILACRSWYLLEKVIAWIRAEKSQNDIKKIGIFVLGDLVNGDIHDRDGGRNECDMTHAAIWVGELLSQMIEIISREIPVEVITVPGNHGRCNIPKLVSSRPTDSWDWLACELARARFVGSTRVLWEGNEAWSNVMELQGYKFFASHGHELKTTLGLPWPAANRKFAERQAAELRRTGEQIHGMVFGHFHRVGSQRDVFISNGCMTGADSFGDLMGMSPVEPIQAGFKVDRERCIDNTYWFNLTDAPDSHGFSLPEIG